MLSGDKQGGIEDMQKAEQLLCQQGKTAMPTSKRHPQTDGSGK